MVSQALHAARDHPALIADRCVAFYSIIGDMDLHVTFVSRAQADGSFHAGFAL